MPYLINPGGRWVAIDDFKEFQKYAAEPGFRKPSAKEEQEYIKKKYGEVTNMKFFTDDRNGVWINTVSQGGKDGYGTASFHLIDELKHAGVNISTHNTGQKIGLLFHNPYSILSMDSPYRIIYTMFESDKIPDDWKDYLDAADKVLVPSKWCAEVFAKAGCQAEVLPLGYNDRVFSYVERENKIVNRKDFIFLHYNAFNLRKGFVEVFKAFNKAFDKSEPVKLIMKTTLDNPQQHFPIRPSEYSKIEVIAGKSSEEELAALCGKADCFVFPSRGEGFGMTPLEAMATGLPTIVPNAHGITEYFNPEFMYEAPLDKENPYCPGIYTRYKNMDVGRMVVTDVDELAKQMRWIYEHQDEARAKGKAASEYVKQWTFQKTAEKLKVIIDDILKKPIEDKPIRNSLTLDLV